MKQRILYFDILKGFAMVSVVAMHVTCQLPEGRWFHPNILFMWHVPLFFLLSGFFITNSKLHDLKSFVRSKFKTLYVKGLYYFIPAVLMHNVFVSWDWYRPEQSNGIAYGNFLNMKDSIVLLLENFLLMNREHIVGAMWFIDTLFLAMTCYGIIFYVTRKVLPSTRESSMLLGLIVLILVTASNIATNIFDLTITKVNNSITAMGLLFIGQQLFQSGKALYINKYSFLGGGNSFMAIFVARRRCSFEYKQLYNHCSTYWNNPFRLLYACIHSTKDRKIYNWKYLRYYW